MNSSKKHIDEDQMPEAVRKHLASKKRRKRITLAILAVLPFALVGLWLWSGSAGDRAIQAEIDRYIAAGEPIYPADFDPPLTPDDNNAALALKNAFAALDIDLDAVRYEFAICCSPKQIAKHHDDFTRIIKTNSEVFKLARQARSMTGADWGVRLRSPVINTTIPKMGDQKHLVKFLCSTAIYYHQAGNDTEAIELLRDAMAAARAMRKMPFLIGYLVSIAQGAIVCQAVEDITVNLKVIPIGASAASGAAKRQNVQSLMKELLDEENIRKGGQWAFYSERAYVFDSAMLVLDGNMGLGADSASKWEKIKVGAFKPALKKDVIRLLRYMTAHAEAAGQTNWPAVKEKMPQFPEAKGAWDRLTHMLSRLLMTTVDRVSTMDFQVRAMRRMSAVALAIRLYEIDNGSRPAKLADLVPKYLPAVPDDPFDNPGQPLRYLPNAQRPILYSIGSNGKDQGGQYAGDPEDPDYSRPRNDYDIPFFLNGDRPRYEDDDEEDGDEPATQPTSAPRPARRRSRG